MVSFFKQIGEWFRSLQGWFWMVMTGGPAIGAWAGGLYDGLPWAHGIAFSMLALAGGGIFAASLVSMWQSLVGRKEKALLALGEVWEDGTDFRNNAAAQQFLTLEDYEKISEIEAEILKHVAVVSKTSLSKFRKMGVYDASVHPPEVQECVLGDKVLLTLSERLRRVDEFIENHSGAD